MSTSPEIVEAGVVAQSETEQPQFYGVLVRAIACQAQISALNNPQRPLPPGLAVSLTDPTTGKPVVF